VAAKSVGADSTLGNIIPFPLNRTAPDPVRDLQAALIVRYIAKAELDLIEAWVHEAKFYGVSTAIGEWRYRIDAAWTRYRAVTLGLALTPAPSRKLFELKCTTISWVGLKNHEGEFSEALRVEIKAGEERLRSAETKDRCGIKRGNKRLAATTKRLYIKRLSTRMWLPE
jgi:hypothetical protein